MDSWSQPIYCHISIGVLPTVEQESIYQVVGR